MRLMDLVPPKTTYSAKTLADDPKEAKLTREELEAQMAVFYKSGGKVQVIEPDARAKKEDGKYTGVTPMPDGTFRITLNGFLVGDGYYATREKATATLLKYQFKDGKIYD